jgi:type I restriction enzyme S subunit
MGSDHLNDVVEPEGAVTEEPVRQAANRGNAGDEGAPLPVGWRWTNLRTIAEVKGGITKGQQRKPGTGVRPVPYLRVANVQRGYIDLSEIKTIEATEVEITELRLLPNDILFNEGGDRDKLGRGWVWSGELPECIHQNHVFRARLLAPTIDPRYISWYGNTAGQAYFLEHGRQTTNLASINLTLLGSLPIPLPPADEQRRIVARIDELLTRLDAAVAGLKQLQARLTRYRAAVLKAAVDGTLTEAWRTQHPDVEPASVLLQRILQERRRAWEQAEIARYARTGKTPPKGWEEKRKDLAAPDVADMPLLPQGWCWVGLRQVASFQNGRAFPSSAYTSEGVRLLRPGNLYADGSVRWTESNTRLLPPTWAEDYLDFIVRGQELVMNLTAQSLKDEFLGRVCLTSAGENCLLNQRLARITPAKGILSQFLLYVLKSNIFRRYVDGLNTGSLIQHMFTSQLEEFAFPLSPLAEQEQIVAEIERRHSVVAAAEAQVEAALKRAERLRQAILQQAFAGKLVQQDPSDEPADVLLERIRAQRTDHGKERATEKPQQLQLIRVRGWSKGRLDERCLS